MSTAAPDAEGYGTTRYRGVVLAMLLLVYIFNFLDRQILGILATPIKQDLGLSDTQLGLLGGLAFAALYSTLAIPLALLADRTSRSWVITVSLTVWSGFTALCGVANNFWQLFLFRLGVGVGEAGGVAPSYSLISSYFPAHQRARALAIYSLGIPIGLAAGTILGAWIAATVDWRWAFIIVGLAGVLVAPVFRLVVKEPPRAVAAEGAPAIAAAPASQVFGILARKKSFWLMAFAAGFSSMCGYGLAFWVPSILIRSYGFDLQETSWFFGSLLLVGGTIGVFMGGWLADRLGQSDRGVYAKLPAWAWAITIPLFAGGFWMTGSPVVAWLLFLIPNGLNILWLGPVTTAVQHLVPPQMRSTAGASFLFINNMIGLGAGTWVMGAMSDAMTASYGDEALRYAAMAALSFYAVATVLMTLAIRPLRREWVS